MEKVLMEDRKIWMNKIAAGSIEAFELFYEHYNQFVYSIALNLLKNKQEAEDITHDVFIEISQVAATYSPEKGSIEAWLAIRTRSRCIDLIRKKREIPTEVQEDRTQTSIYNPIEETVMRQVDGKIITNALKQLPDSQRSAVYGSFFQNFTHKELANRLNLPLGTVKSLIRYGLRNLRKQLVQSKSLNYFKGDE